MAGLKMKFEWEKICSHGDMATMRARVFGGWIVRTVCWTKEWTANVMRGVAESSVFVPDPKHEWEIEG